MIRETLTAVRFTEWEAQLMTFLTSKIGSKLIIFPCFLSQEGTSGTMILKFRFRSNIFLTLFVEGRTGKLNLLNGQILRPITLMTKWTGSTIIE
jgi:hypothetical protein